MDGNDELDLAFRAARAEQVDATAARIERAVRAKLFAAIGQRVGRYETRGVLGRGGLGIVFRGYDHALDRQVAIKLIRTEDAGITPQARARLLREARALAGIVHPNVLEIFDVGEHGEDVYLLYDCSKARRWRAGPRGPSCRTTSSIVSSQQAADWQPSARPVSSTATSSRATSCSPTMRASR